VLAATVTGYSIGLFVHVLAVVLILGPTYGFAFFVGAAEESSPASAASGALGDEYTALSQRIATGGKIAGAIVAITIFFMVVQP
jgi:hypothetical protein